MPPLTCMVSPVIYEDASEDKKATVFETSSPLPSRFMGILEISSDLYSSDIYLSTSLRLKTKKFYNCLEV